MPAQATLEAFKARLRGELLQANDAGYETARKVYNGMIDRHPRLIVRCANVADVIATVHFGRDNDMLVAVRGGGYNGIGLGTCDDGLVIDLSRMKGMRVDPVPRTVRVEGGSTWGDVDHTTHASGLAMPSGIISTTDVGGLDPGGRLGHLTRTCGLSIDNLLAVDMILADGRLVTASTKMYGIVWCYTGRHAQAEATFKPIRSFRRPALDLVGPLPHPALQRLFDPLYPSGLQWYWRADFVNELSDAAIALHVKHASDIPTLHSTMHLYPINGAAHRVGKHDTAWSYRDATWAQVIVGVDPNPANNDKIIGWTKTYWEALHPYSAGGAYVNFMMDEGAERVKATYRDNYERLVTLKNLYDPTNLFRVNQNIKPTV